MPRYGLLHQTVGLASFRVLRSDVLRSTALKHHRFPTTLFFIEKSKTLLKVPIYRTERSDPGVVEGFRRGGKHT